MIRAVGIDLAAQASNTGVCLVLPAADFRWTVTELHGRGDDNGLVDVARIVDVVGVDAPLGWPMAFVAAVSAHSELSAWPGTVDRSRLTHRETDRRVKELCGVSALSVSADKIGVVAMRCALLQRRWADEVWGRTEPRDGSGALVETYPAAALRRWGIDTKGYKGGAGDKAIAGCKARTSIIQQLAEATKSWLDLDAIAVRCVESDHVLDAVTSALVAIATKSGQTEAPIDRDAALVEGWIRLPVVPCADIRPPR